MTHLFFKKGLFILTLYLLVSSYAHAGITIINGLTHVHDAHRGEVITGQIQMHNQGSKKPERVVVGLKEFHSSCDGSEMTTTTLDIDKSISKWISFNTNEKVLKSGEKFTLKYTIKVPETFSPEILAKGSFWSIVMVEGDDIIKENVINEGLKVNSKIRYGIQVIVNLGDKDDPQIEFVDVKLDKKREDKSTRVDVLLENQGVFLVRPLVSLTLYNDAGEEVKKIETKIKKVYPESCTRYVLILEDLPKQEFEGVLVADYGSDMYAVNLSINNT